MGKNRHVSYTKEEREARVNTIVGLYGTCSFNEISRRTGSGVKFIKKVLREQGIEPVVKPFKIVCPKSEMRKKEIVELVKSGMLYKDIARRFNITSAYVSLVAKEKGIKIPKEEVSRRKGIGFKKLMKAEKRRLRFGLEQRTKRRISINPNRRNIYELRIRLRKRGYIMDDNLMEVYYDDSTRRYSRSERTASKYNIRIVPL